MNEIRSVSDPSLVSSTRTRQTANERIALFMGHAIKMLDALKEQNQAVGITAEKLDTIYQSAEKEILSINAQIYKEISQPSLKRIEESHKLEKKLEKAQAKLQKHNEKVANLNNALNDARQSNQSPTDIATLEAQLQASIEKQLKSQETVSLLTNKRDDAFLNLSKAEVKNLKKDLAEAEKKIANILLKTQIEVAAEIGEQHIEGTRSRVAILAKGGWSAKWIRFLALVSDTNKKAIDAFNIGKGLMEAASREDLPFDGAIEPNLNHDKRAEFRRYQEGTGSLDRRAGVIGLSGIYRFQTLFSQAKVKKQFKSFIAQNISQNERKTLEREMTIGESSFLSKMIPLNVEFDQHIGKRGTITTVFTSIFGTQGISSANRQESHLVNGWESNLTHQGKTIFRALRHAITSDKYEQDPNIRQANSKKAAEELIKAALLQEIAALGLSIEEAQAKGIQLNLTSVSLVTPDDLRPHLPGQANERKMLLDQVLALQSVAEESGSIELDGVAIPVEIQVNAFNFGVNALASTFKMGLENQYEQNEKAMEGFQQQFTRWNDSVEREIEMLREHIDTLHPQDSAVAQTETQIAHLLKLTENASLLMKDIENLMSDKKAYLNGDNQYEIGAKILNLSNLMDQTIEFINKDKEPENRLAGFKCAFNCMSGKDRTGFMDAVAKSFASIAESHEGRYPSHEELINDEALRQEFMTTLETMLLKAGNLEITEINTNAKGLKIQKEARLLGMPAETFLQVQGLSSTTSS